MVERFHFLFLQHFFFADIFTDFSISYLFFLIDGCNWRFRKWRLGHFLINFRCFVVDVLVSFHGEHFVGFPAFFFLDCSVKFQFDFRLSFRHFCWRLGRWLVQLIFNPFQIDLERFLAVSKLIFSFERSPIEIWNLLMSNVWLVFSQNLVSLPIIFISDFDWFSVGVEQIDGELRLKMNRVRIGFDCLNDDLLRRQFLNVVSRRLVQYLVVASVGSHRTMTLEFIELIF